MSVLDFPTSPTNGQYYNGYVFNASLGTWDSAYAPRAATIPISSPNYIINGAFDIWQRGTSFSNPAGGTYQADRFITFQDGTGVTRTVSRQAFDSGTSPISSIDTAYYLRYSTTVLGTTAYQAIQSRVEDVRTLAGQTVTFSFYAKADAAKTISLNIQQNFGSGGSSTVFVDTSTTFAITTSWQRFTKTLTFPSLVGKTIGTSSFLQVGLEFGAQLLTIDLCGWQLEAGAAPTEFRRNAPSVASEFATCRRYFQVYGNSPVGNFTIQAMVGPTFSTTQSAHVMQFDVPLRATPAISASSATHFSVDLVGVTASGGTSMLFDHMNENMTRIIMTYSSNGSMGGHKAAVLSANNTGSARIYVSAEL